jgi:predicted Fe-S protein YdhL (DUF1289 family)
MMHAAPSLIPFHITADSPCVGHCSTTLGDDVCRSCQRTFEEITRWIQMEDEERRAVNWRIAQLNQTALTTQNKPT